MTDKEFLEHFGIPGMHWGMRKHSSSITSTTNHQSHKSDPKVTSEDHQKKVTLKKKKISQMSNAELKSINERLQLERQYKDLTKSEVSAGRKFVTDVFVNAAKQTASTYAAKYMSKGVDAIVKKLTE